jgi:hypothetical protein
LFFQPRWKARYLSGLTFAPLIQSEVKPPCEWAGDADAAGIDVAAPDGIVQQRGDIERDVERALPELVGEIE